MDVVLVEPEIPYNAGNIARTCAATGCVLHLVRPLGFSINDKYLKRAGLDYWHLVEIKYWNSFAELETAHPCARFVLATTKGRIRHSEWQFREDDFLVFGKETRGLPDDILQRYPDRWIRLPMKNAARSLNLANAVAVVVYEALRQLGYPGLV